jgi:hypothetical protein
MTLSELAGDQALIISWVMGIPKACAMMKPLFGTKLEKTDLR